MNTYARIHDGVVAELFETSGDITAMFHPSLVWVECDSSVSVGDAYDNGVFTKPNPAAPVLITIFSSLDYLSRFTDVEYQAARTGPMRAQRALDMLIAAQYVDIVNDPRVPTSLDIMIEDCGMTPERKTELLTPQPAA